MIFIKNVLLQNIKIKKQRINYKRMKEFQETLSRIHKF